MTTAELTKPPVGRPAARPMPTFVLIPFAAGGGLLASTAFAPLNWWPAAFVAVVVLGAVIGQAARLRSAILLGLVYGLTFNLVTLAWEDMVGHESYLGLVGLEMWFFALLGALLFAVRGARWSPVLSAASWLAVEFLQARVPFGGFGWTRLGYTVIDTPLTGFYPFVGGGVVTFLIALVGHAVLWAAKRRTWRRAAVAAGTAASLFAVGAVASLLPGAPAGSPTLQVGWVQGGAPGGGVYGIGPAGTMGRNHAAETQALLRKVAAGQFAKPDFIVWPENGTDMDPFLDASTNAAIANSVAQAGVPILVTVPVNGPGVDERQTSALWWTNAGVQARYDKRDLVPFGEWIPFRSLLLPLIPMLEYVGAQTVPGTGPGALHVTGPDGRPLTVGVAICFEVAFPATMYDAIEHGGEVMVVQSSNAMFQGSAQIEQQFQITRVRAAEMRRQILVDTTSGISGLIDERGAVVMRGKEHVADSGVVTLARTTVLTPVMRGGWLVEWLVVGALAVWLASRVGRRAALRRTKQWDSTGLDGKRNDG